MKDSVVNMFAMERFRANLSIKIEIDWLAGCLKMTADIQKGSPPIDTSSVRLDSSNIRSPNGKESCLG